MIAELASRMSSRRSVLWVPTRAWMVKTLPRSRHWICGGAQEAPQPVGVNQPVRPFDSATRAAPGGAAAAPRPEGATKHAFAPPQSGAAASSRSQPPRVVPPLV